MAQAPSKLNKPTAEIAVAEQDGKELPIAKKFWAWLAALGGIAGDWVVDGALHVIGASALDGAVTLGTAVATPAAGQIGKGDANWIAPVFGANWSSAAGLRASAYRKLPDGTVSVELNAQTTVANDGSATFVLPAGYRPSGNINRAAISTTGVAMLVQIQANGNVLANALAAAPSTSLSGFNFYAEQ